MTSKSLYNIHFFALIIMSTGFMVHVLLIPTLLSVAKRDAWISILFSLFPSVIWILLVFFIIKKLKGMDILAFLKKKIHPYVGYFTAVSFSIYFILNAYVTLRSTIQWAQSNYTFDVPLTVISLCMVLVCLYCSMKGIQTISMMALLTLPFVSFFGFIVGFGNHGKKEYSLLFPAFQEGLSPIMTGAMYASIGCFETILILFLIPFSKKRMNLKGLFFIMLILIMLLFGPLTGAIAEFNVSESSHMLNPTYEQWRLLSFGRYITRLDFLSIFQWLSGAFIRISLSIFLANYILFGLNKKWPIFVIYFLLFAAAYIPVKPVLFVRLLKDVYYPYSLGFLIVFISLFLIMILWKKPGGNQLASEKK
jgi:spore germination protein KB